MIVRPIRKRICDGVLSDEVSRRQWDRRRRTHVAHCKPGERMISNGVDRVVDELWEEDIHSSIKK
jgi:hypothetical protein